MNTRKVLVWLGVGVFSGLLMSDVAFAHDGFLGGRGEIGGARRELRGDWGELRRDRAELRRDLRGGAPASEIAGDRAEIRGDWQELARDRWDLRNNSGWDRDDWYHYRGGWFDRYGRWHPYWQYWR
jgi:hypothetical protein